MLDQMQDLFYKNLVDKCPDGVIVSRDDQIVFLNQASLDFLGINDISEIKGRPLEDFIHPDDRKATRLLRKIEMDQNGHAVAGTVRLLRADGSIVTTLAKIGRAHV